MKSTHRSLAACLLASAALLTTPATAQTPAGFPSKNVLLVVPQQAGGPTDVLVRMFQPRLAALLGQSVIVDNKVGAAGYIALDFVANAPPDGYTLVAQAYGGLHSHLFTKGNRVMSRELAPVAMIGETPNVVLVSSTIPSKTLKEFIDYARSNKGKLNVAIVPNTAIHLETLVFLRAINVEMTEVPYNGAAPIYQGLARGDLHFFMATVGGSKPAVDSGIVRVLAVPFSRRVPQLPDVPTSRELGYDFSASQAYAVFAPVKTPPALIRVLNEKVAAALNTPDVRERLEKIGYIVEPGQPDALATRLATEAQTMERAARDAKIVPQ
jgi:tripartite-type tricarboxylate transporter receptor subunit TctC